MKVRWRLLLSVAVVALGNALPGVAGDGVAVKVERRVKDWQPTKEERLLDQVGWAGGLAEGRRLAKEHRRPLFVFTYDGCATRANALALQRC